MNKHRRHMHESIRDIQRTDLSGKMPYRQARRKYKEGLRAIPIKFTTGTRWMLMDFGEIGIRSSEAKRLGSELTDIFISALWEGYNVYVRYETDHNFFTVEFLKRVGRFPVCWSYTASYYEAVINPAFGFAELVIRAANSAFDGSVNFRKINDGFLSVTFASVYADETENAIRAKHDTTSVDYQAYAYGMIGSIQFGKETRELFRAIIDRRVETLMKASETRGIPVCHEISDYAKRNKEGIVNDAH